MDLVYTCDCGKTHKYNAKFGCSAQSYRVVAFYYKFIFFSSSPMRCRCVSARAKVSMWHSYII